MTGVLSLPSHGPWPTPLIDRAVIKQATAVASLGQTVRLRLPVDVLVAPDFLEHVVSAVRDVRAEPELITFEIPDAAGTAGERLARVARALAGCRFRLAS
jgi:EAL domain-containing protein (putative c-di-GMP-specific phosphodiesterase class I)